MGSQSHDQYYNCIMLAFFEGSKVQGTVDYLTSNMFQIMYNLHEYVLNLFIIKSPPSTGTLQLKTSAMMFYNYLGVHNGLIAIFY